MASSAMSPLGLHEPKTVPHNVLFIRMKSCSAMAIDPNAGDGSPVSTQVPPLRVSASAAPTSASPITAGETTTASAITPRVRSRTSSTASAAVAAVWVAPNVWAEVRLKSLTSTATIRAAPLMRAPWTAAVPIPPVPITTTVSPPRTPARRAADPYPVGTAQASRAAGSRGRPESIFTSELAATTVCSANAPILDTWPRLRPSTV
ncbi:hypothetical protein A5692_15060 [Mycobacterium sp. E342]|nr:hypothetical protein A5692_15060 [Mycobacterium sp. E342]